MKRPLVIAMSLVALSSPLAFMSSPALVTAAHAAAPDVSTLRATSYEFVAWSTDSTLILLKLQDPQAGVIFQVRDAKTGEIFKAGNKPAVFPSQNAPNSDEERKFIKQLINGKVKVDGQPVKFDQPGVAEATHPVKTDIMLMLGQKGDKLVVMGIRGDKASKYHSFDLLKDKKGVVAKASQKALIWDNDGKNVCIIYNQKLESADTPFDGDFFEVLPFKSYKVKGGSDDKEGGGE